MSEFKVGDTVDPRMLPVGAEWHYVGFDTVRRVTRHGFHVPVDAPDIELETGCPGVDDPRAILLSLPTPKRPPCDACGEESTHTLYFDSLGHTNTCDGCTFREKVLARRAQQTSTGSDSVREAHKSSRAATELPPGSGPSRQAESVASSLPTYDQIAGWLGAEWVMTFKGWELTVPARWVGQEEDFHPSPWLDTHTDDERFFRCYLRHTSGQRVEVTAPKDALPEYRWRIWFANIKRVIRETAGCDYEAHVRWLDPDTKDSTGSEGGEAPDSLSREPSQATPSEPVIPPRCSSCKQPFWAGRPEVEKGAIHALCGDCVYSGCIDPADHLTNGLDTRIAEVAEPAVRVEDMPGAWMSPTWEDVS